MAAPISFWRDTVEVVYPAIVDSDAAGTKLDWKNATTLTIEECLWQPLRSNESGADDLLVARCFIPGRPIITARDKIRFEGEEFVIFGRPLRHRSPTGALDHVELELRSVNQNG